MLDHDLQLGEISAQWNQLRVDKGFLAVEDVDGRIGHFAMHQQQNAFALHGFQGLVGLADVGHACVAVGRGAGGVELDGHDAGLLCPADLFGR